LSSPYTSFHNLKQMFNTYWYKTLFRNLFFNTQKLYCHLITEWQTNFLKHSYLILSYFFF
jgi:hypothetical protein